MDASGSRGGLIWRRRAAGLRIGHCHGGGPGRAVAGAKRNPLREAVLEQSRRTLALVVLFQGQSWSRRATHRYPLPMGRRLGLCFKPSRRPNRTILGEPPRNWSGLAIPKSPRTNLCSKGPRKPSAPTRGSSSSVAAAVMSGSGSRLTRPSGPTPATSHSAVDQAQAGQESRVPRRSRRRSGAGDVEGKLVFPAGLGSIVLWHPHPAGVCLGGARLRGFDRCSCGIARHARFGVFFGLGWVTFPRSRLLFGCPAYRYRMILEPAMIVLAVTAWEALRRRRAAMRRGQRREAKDSHDGALRRVGRRNREPLSQESEVMRLHCGSRLERGTNDRRVRRLVPRRACARPASAARFSLLTARPTAPRNGREQGARRAARAKARAGPGVH